MVLAVYIADIRSSSLTTTLPWAVFLCFCAVRLISHLFLSPQLHAWAPCVLLSFPSSEHPSIAHLNLLGSFPRRPSSSYSTAALLKRKKVEATESAGQARESRDPENNLHFHHLRSINTSNSLYSCVPASLFCHQRLHLHLFTPDVSSLLACLDQSCLRTTVSTWLNSFTFNCIEPHVVRFGEIVM